jgi:hypothetical protein
MEANTHMDLPSCFCLGVVGPELLLNLLCALHGMHHRGKVYEERIANGLDDRPVMHSHGLVDGPIVRLQQLQHARFIVAHLATKAHNVSEHDRGQVTGLSVNHRGYLLLQPRFAQGGNHAL